MANLTKVDSRFVDMSVTARHVRRLIANLQKLTSSISKLIVLFSAVYSLEFFCFGYLSVLDLNFFE